MIHRLVTIRDRVVRALSGYDKSFNEKIAAQISSLELKVEALQSKIVEAESAMNDRTNALGHLVSNSESSLNILKADRDNIPYLRKKLWEVRESDRYKKTLNDRQPLISVRIPTYNKPDKLVDIAIKSVLNQTYQNFEIIVVGDNCDKETGERIASLKNKKITYVNFPQRNLYPDDPMQRWQVAGSPGMNLGAHLAKGQWIAPLDDDDEFSEDHLEKLLTEALSTKSEMVYGALIQRNTITKEEKKIWSSPPEAGKFSFQGAMYMKELGFFEYDQQSWVVGEPGDWNLCRRMRLAGVRMSSLKDVVGIMHTTPYTHKDKK